MKKRLILLCASGLCIGLWASAQTAPRAVTTDLLERILGADAEVQVGELPATLPVPLALPDEIAVDAAVTRRWMDQQSVQLFLTSALPLAETVAALGESLAAASLTPHTLPEDAYGWGGAWGFSYADPRDQQPELFCGEDAYALLFLEPGSSPVHITLNLDERRQGLNVYTPCDAETYGHGPSAPPVPALEPPPQAKIIGLESGGTFGAQTSTIAFETGPSPDVLLEYYGALLREAGWREDLTGGDEVLRYSRFSGQSDSGEPWSLVMVFSGEALNPGWVVGVLVAAPLGR